MSEIDERRHACLELLRPICISLMKDSTKENVKTLLKALPRVDDRIAQEIQQYILFPVQAALRHKDLTEPLLSELCHVVVVVFQKTKVPTVGTFLDTFNPLMFSLTPKDGSRKVVFQFEETKAVLIRALAQLFKASQEMVLCEIYCVKFIPALGQLVAVLLSFAEMEKSREIQRQALDCLLVVLQKESKFGKKYEAQLSALFPFCLPGVTMATCRIATGDVKQGHSIVVKAMEVFAATVTLVMSDSSLEKVKESPAKVKVTPKPDQEIRPSLSVERSDNWVKATGSKVKVLLDRMCRLVSSDNWRVRLGLADLCEQLLTSCSRSLSESLPKILETLVGLINDPYGNVARKASGALQAFSSAASEAQADSSAAAGGRTLMEILEENLHGLTSSLPRQIRMCDEDEKPALIRLLNGYISLLGPKISCVVDSAPHLARLCLSLVQALELDARDLRIVEERGSTLDHDSDTFVEKTSTKIWKPKKFFKHFRDEAILSELLLACRQLGKYGNIHTLVDHLLDVCQSSATYRLAGALVINEMVIGAGRLEQGSDTDSACDLVMPHNAELLPDVISLLLDEYLSPENLKLLDAITEETPVSSSPPSLSSALVVVGGVKTARSKQMLVHRNRAILQMCLHMEGLAKFATVLGPDRQEHLIRTLYPLVENLGHENLHISSTAYTALVDVAVAGGYRSLDSLLRRNADYLVSSVSLRLRHFQLNRRTPQTLCVMLRYCSGDLLPHVRRSITQLLDSLDDHYTEHLVLFMPVLLELVRAVQRWFPALLEKEELKESKKEGDASLDQQKLVDFLQDHVKTKQLAEGDFNMEGHQDMTLDDIEREMKARQEQAKEETEDQVLEDPEEETKKEAPPHIVMVKEVFQRVRNLLSTNNGRLRVQCLDVVTQGFECLRGHERELLPQIHQMWAGLRPLFNSQEKFIVIKAVQTLLSMSEAAGDFLRQRVVKEVVPGLVGYMGRQAKISCGCHSGYLHTANYKLQLCLLSAAGPLAVNLQLDRNHLDQIARLCLPYLSDAQPLALQQASKAAFSSFISLDCDAMWLLLTQIHSPWCLEPPSSEFASVRLPASATKKTEHSTNICEVFRRHYNLAPSEVSTAII